MSEQVIAPDCGHWTKRNPDGSIPCECRYCFRKGAEEVEKQMREGTLRLPPKIMQALIELPQKLLRDGPKILEEYRREIERKEKEGGSTPSESL